MSKESVETEGTVTANQSQPTETTAPGFTPAQQHKVEVITEAARERYPEDQWTLDITWWADGSMQVEAFHSIERIGAVFGETIREYMTYDSETGDVTTQKYSRIGSRVIELPDEMAEEYPITGYQQWSSSGGVSDE